MDFLEKTCKKVFKTKKSEYNNRVLHIRNSLGTKFQLKLTISIFYTKKKGGGGGTCARQYFCEVS